MPSVRVLVRARPLLRDEVESGATCSLLNLGSGHISLVNKQGGTSNYGADHVCGPESSQDEIFQKGGLTELVGAAVDGYSATVFAYGQTGSGKTFTMEGYNYTRAAGSKGPSVDFDTPKERLGVVPRTLRTLFEAVHARNAGAAAAKSTFRVKCHFVQIYKEQVLDLLNPASGGGGGGGGGGRVFGGGAGLGAPQGLRMRWSPEKEFFVDNLFVEEVATAEEAEELFQRGVRNKRVAETRMNTASSRSHCMLTLLVQQLATDRAEKVLAEGRLTLVDLAGSERQHALLEPTNKAAMHESVQINKSLFTLRKVILALSEASGQAEAGKKVGHVPYRDSTLTRLLKHALGGNSHTLMVACLSPSDLHVEENASTLAYAARARAIKNEVRVNTDPHTAQVLTLKAEIARLKAEIVRLQQIIELGGMGGGGTGGGGDGVAALTLTGSAAKAAGGELALAGAIKADELLSGPVGTGNGFACSQLVPTSASASAPPVPMGREEGAAAVAKAVGLAKALASTNGQLREAFDALASSREELEAAHGLLLVENTSQRERLSLLELALAMESYPSAPHESMQARVEAQLRAAAQEVVALRTENASLKDSLAMHPAWQGGGEGAGYRLQDGGPPPRTASTVAGGHQVQGTAPRANATPYGMAPAHGGGGKGGGGRAPGNAVGYGLKPRKGAGGGQGQRQQQQQQQQQHAAAAAAAEMAASAPTPPISLSSTGGLLMSSAWIPPAPAASGTSGAGVPLTRPGVVRAGSGAGYSSVGYGGAGSAQRTVPRLVPGSGLVPGGMAMGGTTVEELDQLSALLRKRAELSQQTRPSTAAPR